MFALACDTGWPRDFILWCVPWPELRIWQHCQSRAAGEWTVEPVDAPDFHEQASALATYQPDEGEFQV